MPSFKLPISKELPPADIFSDMPQAFRSYLKHGFEQLGELPQSKIGSLVTLLGEGHEAMDEVGVNEILRRLELKVREKDSFGTALGVLTLFVTGRDDVTEVISAAEAAGVIPTTSSLRIRELVVELTKTKAMLTAVVESTSLANEVAPSFQSLTLAVELRFGFDEVKIARTVPIAICHLNTDSQRHHCFFQLTKSDVAQMIFQLKQAEDRLNAIEAWSKERQ